MVDLVKLKMWRWGRLRLWWSLSGLRQLVVALGSQHVNM